MRGGPGWPRQRNPDSGPRSAAPRRGTVHRRHAPACREASRQCRPHRRRGRLRRPGRCIPDSFRSRRSGGDTSGHVDVHRSAKPENGKQTRACAHSSNATSPSDGGRVMRTAMAFGLTRAEVIDRPGARVTGTLRSRPRRAAEGETRKRHGFPQRQTPGPADGVRRPVNANAVASRRPEPRTAEQTTGNR